jgi:hypothetical protein
VYRRVIISRGPGWLRAREERGEFQRIYRRAMLDAVAAEARGQERSDARGRPRDSRVPAALRPAQVGLIVVMLTALLVLVTSEVILPGLFELLVAAVLLGGGVAAAAGSHARRDAADAREASRAVHPDPQEKVRRHLRLLEQRRHRCLDALGEVERCGAFERAAGRETERLDTAAAIVAERAAAFDAGIAREQASGLALRVARWIDRLPSLMEGLERLDRSSARRRLKRLEAIRQDGETLAAELREHPCSAEETARRARALLDVGIEEIDRLRVDLLEHYTAQLTTAAAPAAERSPALAEVESALSRSWDWICHSEARRELGRWVEAARDEPFLAPEPIRIPVPRGRDRSLLPFSLVLLGFTSAHASLAVGSVATATPLLLVPMAGFYALFLVPGVLLLREAVQARREEELTLCGASVMLRWRWLFWSGEETIAVAPDEPIRREEVGRVDAHPIHRLSLRGLDGRRLSFAFGLTEPEHTALIQRLGHPSEPALSAPAAAKPAQPLSAPPKRRPDDDENRWGLPLF